MPDKYTTTDEFAFVNRLHKNDRLAFTKYADMVLTGKRRYDKGVDVERVESLIHYLLLKDVL